MLIVTPRYINRCAQKPAPPSATLFFPSSLRGASSVRCPGGGSGDLIGMHGGGSSRGYCAATRSAPQ